MKGKGKVTNHGMGQYEQILIYADRHTGIESKESDNVIKKYIADNKKYIKYVIDLGDGIDNPFMSDFPVDPKFVLSAQEEFDMYAKHWYEIEKLVPNSKKVIIAGNHDKARLDKAKNLKRGLASLRNLQYESILKEALSNYNINLKNFTFADPNYELKVTKSNSALFTHGDPRLDPNIKGGVTGARRTAEMYPFNGNIYMGHQHHHIEYPRRFEGKHLVVLGGMFDIEKMKKMYMNQHPYENGFGVIFYNKKKDLYLFEYIKIEKGVAIINGKTYNGNK